MMNIQDEDEARKRQTRPIRFHRVMVFCVGVVALWPGGWLLAQTGPARERVPLDDHWQFIHDDPAEAAGKLMYNNVKAAVESTGGDLQDAPEATITLPGAPSGHPGEDVSYVQPGFDDHAWRTLNLPHDWGIEGPFKQEYPGNTGKLPWWGVGWYRKHFLLPKADEAKRVFLQLDGAMAYSMVWINGHFAGGWPYGYSSYQVELTPYLVPGSENVVAIRLDNPKGSSRWYPGGGIYRHVWLVKTSPVHVAFNGTYLTTPNVSATSAEVDLRMSIDNQSASEAPVTVSAQVCELQADNTAGAALTKPVAVSLPLPAGKRQTAGIKIDLPNPKLWDLKNPNRYVAVTTLTTADGALLDRYETPFGVRTIRFDPNTGFFLNGQHVEINGVCDHADLGALGIAVNTRALQRQIEILQSMGCNAIRTSHNPPAPELLELCDKMGMLVMDEAFDCWISGKNANDYHVLFPAWHSKDLRALVRRDRNHPCVILWSTGNEIVEQGSNQKLAHELSDIVHSEDPTRPVTAACNNVEAGFNGFQKAMDVFGYNYKYGSYQSFHEKNPDQPLYGSETLSTVSSRGEYFFPLNNDHVNFQVSSYVLSFPPWASAPDPELEAEAKFPFVCGQFIWTGFDYLGEPTPYNSDTTNLLNFSDPVEKAKMEAEMKELGKLPVPSRSSYFGAVDLAGFPKDLFYLLQAAWRPELPMAHILPHWNWPDRMGQVTPVFVFTSGDEAELFLNGNSLGRKKKDASQFRLRWDDVKYEPGELKIVAYKAGKPWAENIVKTTGPAQRLTLMPDRKVLHADGQDLCFITAAITDAAGLVVPRSNNAIDFEMTGPGEIVATDNGDATSHVSFQSLKRNAFNGLALVVVRTQPGKAGNIVVQAKSDGLQTTATSLSSQ